jgi:hypothetical protein
MDPIAEAEYGRKYFLGQLDESEKNDIDPHKVLKFALRNIYFDDFRGTNTGKKSYFDRLEQEGWLTIIWSTQTIPFGEPGQTITLSIIKGYTINDGAENDVQQYLQKIYDDIVRDKAMEVIDREIEDRESLRSGEVSSADTAAEE